MPDQQPDPKEAPSREMTKAELAASDAKLETYYKRVIKFSGFRAQLAKNERDEAVYTRERLSARIDIYQAHGKLKKLAEEEGIKLDAPKAQAAPSEGPTPTSYASTPEITHPEKEETSHTLPGSSHTEA